MLLKNVSLGLGKSSLSKHTQRTTGSIETGNPTQTNALVHLDSMQPPTVPRFSPGNTAAKEGRGPNGGVLFCVFRGNGLFCFAAAVSCNSAESFLLGVKKKKKKRKTKMKALSQ